MPVEPTPAPWDFKVPARADDFIAVGGDLEPGTLLAAYRAGLFPMPALGDGAFVASSGTGEIGWWSPRQRGVLRLDRLKVSSSLRKSVRRFEIRVDTAFREVVEACADPDRPYGWISDDFVDAYERLHQLGWAHSVESWREGVLAGGLYGVSVGGLFAGESMFSHQRDASKVALVALVERLRDEYAAQRLIDTQWLTPHLATLGVEEMPRANYLSLLPRLLATPLPDWGDSSRASPSNSS